MKEAARSPQAPSNMVRQPRDGHMVDGQQRGQAHGDMEGGIRCAGAFPSPGRRDSGRCQAAEASQDGTAGQQPEGVSLHARRRRAKGLAGVSRDVWLALSTALLPYYSTMEALSCVRKRTTIFFNRLGPMPPCHHVPSRAPCKGSPHSPACARRCCRHSHGC